VQELDTSGARAVMPFRIEEQLYLAIPQLAQDIDGQAANMKRGGRHSSSGTRRAHDSYS
jgi:hypothetical protein